MSKLSYYQNITPSNSAKQKAKELNKEGLSFRAIAKKLGVGKTTVERWVKEDSAAKFPNEKPDLPENSSELPTKSSMKPDSNTENRTVSQESQGNENESGGASERVAMRKLELEHERELKRIDLEQKRMWQKKEEQGKRTLAKLLRPIQQWAMNELTKASDCPSGVPCLVSDIHDMHQFLRKSHKKLTRFQENSNNWRALDYTESLSFLLLTTEEWSKSMKNTYKEELSGKYELTYKWNNLDIQYVEQLAENA